METRLIIIFALLSCFIGKVHAENIIAALSARHIQVGTLFHNLGKEGMELTLQNTTEKPLSITIPSSMTFHPASDDQQILINLEEKTILIAGKGRSNISLTVYCTENHKKLPFPHSRFTLKTCHNKELVALVDFLNERKVSKFNHQSAIWALTDARPIANINPVNQADVALRKYLAKVTGRENPWYANEQIITANHGETISVQPKTINGYLSVDSPRNISFKIFVIDQEGNEKIAMPDIFKIYKDKENSFNFNLVIVGWDEGEYEILFKQIDNDKVLANYSFKL